MLVLYVSPLHSRDMSLKAIECTMSTPAGFGVGTYIELNVRTFNRPRTSGDIANSSAIFEATYPPYETPITSTCAHGSFNSAATFSIHDAANADAFGIFLQKLPTIVLIVLTADLLHITRTSDMPDSVEHLCLISGIL